MRTRISPLLSVVLRHSVLTALVMFGAGQAQAQTVVPGSGRHVKESGDTFEDAAWEYVHAGPKSSFNLDKRSRAPYGESVNGLWNESSKRGDPEIIKRVPTPEGGLSGSKGSLLMRSLHTGIPGRPSFDSQQDDLIMDLSLPDGGSISVDYSPSLVVRIYMPPFEKWEQVNGTSFGMRASVTGRGPHIGPVKRRGFLGLFRDNPRRRRIDAYYPGMFIQFNPKSVTGAEKDSAVFLIRADEQLQDVMGPEITQTGWWTIGMSFTPDGKVNYYVSPGVDDLTAKDHVASYRSQSVDCMQYNTIFFNIVNQDDGQTWSTPWIIDDPSLYYIDDTQEAQKAPPARQ